MDIKLRNIKYSKITKAIAVFLLWLSVMGLVFSAVFLLYNQEIVNTGSYYETYRFVENYSELIKDVTELKVKFHEEEAVAVSTATPVQESPNKDYILELKDRLANSVNFAYYIKNTQNGDTITNVNDADRVAFLKKQPTYIYIGKGQLDTIVYSNKESSHDTGMYYFYDINRMLEGTPYEVHAALMEPLKPGDMFYDGYNHYSSVKSIVPIAMAALAASLVFIILAFIYLINVTGRKEKDGEISLTYIDRIYTDVLTVIVLIAAIISVLTVIGSVNSLGRSIEFFIAVAIILTIDVFIGLSYILSIARQIKSRRIMKNLLVCKLYKLIRSFAIMALSGKLFKPWILLVLLGYGIINGILFAGISSQYHRDQGLAFIIELLLIAFNAAAVYFAAKSLGNLTQIMDAVKEVSAGNLDYELNKNEITVAFLGLAGDLQNLQKGLKTAVSEAVKGERMKTELITNVSHDLKTPLTSIINYVDLLKKEDIENDNAKEYISVLDEKSARLKQLVEDLIEASKASSGSISVNTEKIDMRQLIMQAYGEYEEKLEKKGLDMRINTGECDVIVNADGRHLWRIMENLLSNVLKYSMSNSRVYVNLDKNEQFGVLTIKNISAFALEVSPEQLTERFVRGDASRSTEGSGLGLSIAQGLTQLQGGKFKIEIDGDLFKVIVEIPLWNGI